MILNNAAAARIGARQVSRIYRGTNEAWPGFTPARLFADGQQGVYYEPKPEYLYQDAAGTIAVTADGDPVGYMADLSGNGNHATQSTSAARPLFPGLAYDGVDDHLSGAPIGTVSTFSLLFAGRANSTGIKTVFKSGDAGLGAGDQWILLRPVGSSSGVSDASGAFRSYTFGVPAGVDFLTEIHLNGSTLEFVLDGVVVNTITANFGTVALTENMFIGASSPSLQFWDGDIPGGILRAGVMTEDEKAKARTYLASLQGRTL